MRLRGALPLLALLLALGFRAALPAGFMPHAQLGMVLCNGSSTQLLYVDPATGELTADGEQQPQGCDFSPLLVQPALVDSPALAVVPRAGIVPTRLAAARLTQRARAPPRARGPPHLT